MVPIYKDYTSLALSLFVELSASSGSLFVDPICLLAVGFSFWIPRGSAHAAHSTCHEYTMHMNDCIIFMTYEKSARSRSKSRRHAYAKQRQHRHLINTEWHTEQRKCITAMYWSGDIIIFILEHCRPEPHGRSPMTFAQTHTHSGCANDICIRHSRKWFVHCMQCMQHALNRKINAKSACDRSIRHDFDSNGIDGIRFIIYFPIFDSVSMRNPDIYVCWAIAQSHNYH